jgi:hypothetical protein
MSLFSRRFWNSLIMHDRRLMQASAGYELAANRYRTSRDCMTGDAQLEFHIELLDAVKELRNAVGELRAFQNRHVVREST